MKLKYIKWAKIFLAIIATIIWLGVIIKVSSFDMPFIQQAPYCMGSTMITFMILNALFRGLDYLGRRS